MTSVPHSQEFNRVAGLPRRTLRLSEACEWATAISPRFALRSDVALRPWQALALVEAVRCDGAWLALPVGQGKTVISYLLPTVLQAKRALLIVPASLHAKTLLDFTSYQGVWRAPTCPVRVVTRESLSVVSGARLLHEYAPELIVIDEADDLSNPRSSAVRRIDRYVRSHDVRVVSMTGTPARKSLLGYWHHLAWCLGDRAPVPLTADEAQLWALALDDHRGQRPGFGPMGPNLRCARAWFSRRLLETPGVVIVDEDSCGTALTVRVRLSREDAELDAAFQRFLVEQENPGGVPVSDPLSRWLLDAQLGLGLYTRWAPPPPDAWREARRTVARFVRERVDASTPSAHPLDTELQVIRRYPGHPAVTTWQAVRPSFDGRTETVWLSQSTIDSCLDWLRELQGVPGIIWTGSVDFGRRLAQVSGLRYFGQRGMSADGVALHSAPPTASMIASWAANKKGFNLQPWKRQLITMPPQSAKWLEQIFGRSHRAGQTDPVIVDVLATSGGTLDAFESAISEAGTVRQTVALTQKLLRAEIVRAEPVITPGNEFRWARRNG